MAEETFGATISVTTNEGESIVSLIEWLQSWGFREIIGLLTGVGFVGGVATIVRGTQAANERLMELSCRPRR